MKNWKTNNLLFYKISTLGILLLSALTIQATRTAFAFYDRDFYRCMHPNPAVCTTTCYINNLSKSQQSIRVSGIHNGESHAAGALPIGMTQHYPMFSTTIKAASKTSQDSVLKFVFTWGGQPVDQKYVVRIPSSFSPTAVYQIQPTILRVDVDENEGALTGGCTFRRDSVTYSYKFNGGRPF